MGLFDRNPEGGALVAPAAQQVVGGGGGGETNTASNLGAGQGIFAGKVGVDLQFKSITAGSGITLTPSGTELQISSTGGGITWATEVDNSIIPDTDNTYDLGSISRKFTSLYCGTVTDSSSNIVIDFNNRVLNDNTGSTMLDWNSTAVEVFASILPNSQLTHDIGASGFEFANLYVNMIYGIGGCGTVGINPTNGYLVDQSAVNALGWDIRQLYDTSGATVLDWYNGYTKLIKPLEFPFSNADADCLIRTEDNSSGDSRPLTIRTGNPTNNNSGLLTLQSGNVNTGNSGDVLIQPGTVVSGTRGKIRLSDASLTGSSVGWVWTLQNITTGEGAWVAAGGGISWSTPVDANIVPDGQNTRDLGASGNEFANLYVNQVYGIGGCGTVGINVSSGILLDQSGVNSVSWDGREITSYSGNKVFDWYSDALSMTRPIIFGSFFGGISPADCVVRTYESGLSNTNNLTIKTGDGNSTFNSGDLILASGSVVSGTRGAVVLNGNRVDASASIGPFRAPNLAADPGSPLDGDIWYNTTSNELKARVNGSTVVLA